MTPLDIIIAFLVGAFFGVSVTVLSCSLDTRHVAKAKAKQTDRKPG